LVSDVRRRTFDIELKAVDLTRKSLFTAKMTPIFITRDERRSIALPETVMIKLDQYRGRCAAI
jgi:acyl-CoA thioesterase FadM